MEPYAPGLLKGRAQVVLAVLGCVLLSWCASCLGQEAAAGLARQGSRVRGPHAASPPHADAQCAQAFGERIGELANLTRDAFDSSAIDAARLEMLRAEHGEAVEEMLAAVAGAVGAVVVVIMATTYFTQRLLPGEVAAWRVTLGCISVFRILPSDFSHPLYLTNLAMAAGGVLVHVVVARADVFSARPGYAPPATGVTAGSAASSSSKPRGVLARMCAYCGKCVLCVIICFTLLVVALSSLEISLSGDGSDFMRSFERFEAKQHYRTLGLEPGAEFAEVKKAYRGLSRVWHPDKCKDDPDVCVAKFNAIRNAYEHLSAQQAREGESPFGRDDATDEASEREASPQPEQRRRRRRFNVHDDL